MSRTRRCRISATPPPVAVELTITTRWPRSRRASASSERSTTSPTAARYPSIRGGPSSRTATSVIRVLATRHAAHQPRDRRAAVFAAFDLGGAGRRGDPRAQPVLPPAPQHAAAERRRAAAALRLLIHHVREAALAAGREPA